MRHPFFYSVGLMVAALGVAGSAAQAEIVSVDTFRNNAYTQTGNGNSLSTVGSFFSADLVSATPADYILGAVSPPTGAKYALTQVSPSSTQFHYQTGYYPTQAAMDADFATGGYLLQGSPGTDSAILSYTKDDYSSSLPYLTGTTFSDLQGMNPAKSFTFNFSAMDPGTATNPYEFFTIYDLTTSTYVYDQGFLSPSTTTLVMPASTLTAGDSYSYELDFSNRDNAVVAGAPNGFNGFDVRTDGQFTAGRAVATPLPSGAAAGLVLMVGVGLFAAIKKLTLVAQ